MGPWKFGRGKGTTNKLAHRLQCEWCGTWYEAKRWDRRTDTSACRSALSRWERRYRAKFNCRPTSMPRGDAHIKNLIYATPDPKPGPKS